MSAALAKKPMDWTEEDAPLDTIEKRVARDVGPAVKEPDHDEWATAIVERNAA